MATNHRKLILGSFRMLLFILFVLVACAAITGNSMARELPPDQPDYMEHSGTISGTETWTVSDNPHIIREGGLTINSTGKVMLEPGVIIQIEGSASLTVQGTLTMTVSSPAALTTITNSGSYFGMIEFQTNSKGFLGNCDISHGGAGEDETILIASTNGVKIQDCRIHDNQPSSQVVHIYGGNAKATLENVTIDNNLGQAIAQSNINARPVFQNVTVQNNDGGDLLAVGAIESNVLLSSRITLSGDQIKPTGVVYLENGMTIRAGGVLTATAGTNFQIGAGRSIVVQWSSTYGPGRFYSDGASFSKRAGQGNFGQIYFNVKSSGALKNCDISRGGSGSGIYEAVKIASSDVIMENCTIHDVAAAYRVVYIGSTGGVDDVGLHPSLLNLELYSNTAQYAIEQSTVNMVVNYVNINAHDNLGVFEGVFLGGGTLFQKIVLDQQALNGDPYYTGRRTDSDGMTIDATAAVTLTAGTELRILPNQALTVKGTLTGLGTQAKPVRFRAQRDLPINVSYRWKYLDIQSTAVVDLEYCEIFHAAGGTIPSPVNLDAAVSILSNNTRLNNCTIYDNGRNATTITLLLAGAGNHASIHATTISGNAGWALSQNDLDMSPDYQDITLTGNNGGAGDVLYITGSTATSTPDVVNTSKVVLDGPSINGSPIFLPNGAVIQAGGTITITASTSVLIGSGSTGQRIDVYGALYAVGTAGKVVTFANKNDAMGDQFGRIEFRAGSTGRLSYCEVNNGGKGYTEMVRVDSSDVKVEDCTLRGGVETSSTAIPQAINIVTQNLTPVFRNLMLLDNQGFGIGQTSTNMAPVYENLVFQGNTYDGLYLGTSNGVNYDQVLDVSVLNGAVYYASSFTMLSGRSITLTPGTELRLLQGSTLNINSGASLVALGTPDQWIILSSNLEAPTPSQYWTGITIQNNASALFAYCEISYSTSAVKVTTSAATPTVFDMDNCNIHHNGTGTQQLLLITGASGTPTPIYEIQNVAIHDNMGSGMYVTSNVNVKGYHLSLIHNSANGVQTGATGVANLENSIIAFNGTGFASGNSNNSTTAVLWHGNTNKVSGSAISSLNDVDAIELPLAQDGYHLSRYAMEAMNYSKASVTGILDDIDGEARPQPVGEYPDLGADEFIFSYGADFAGEKAAFAPKWVVTSLDGHVVQKYLVRVFQGLTSQELTVQVSDHFPSGLIFTGEEHPNWMDFTLNGSLLTWQTNQTMGSGEAALLLMDGVGSFANGAQLENTGEVTAGALQQGMSVTTVVPVFKPLISSPLSGPVCPGMLNLKGAAQPGATVKLFANNVQFNQVLVGSDSTFTTQYNYTGGSVALTAEACFGSSCSGQGQAVSLTQCSGEIPPAVGSISGVVSDASHGSPVAGMSVTLMVNLPDWGGWVPWPASLYGETNPKVSLADGSFVFTNLPPGNYHLQTASLPGYYPYRSPETLVIAGAEMVVNIPFAQITIPVRQIVVKDDGLLPDSLTVNSGETVEWVVPVDGMARPDALVALVENPIIRILSTLDPQTDPAGWDSGLLYPGQSFQHTFITPGDYTYSDGLGHSGSITVVADKIYLHLPFVIK